MTRTLIAIGLVAAGALLGAVTTAELNEARPMLGPMAVDVSPFLNAAALALAVTLVWAGRALHPPSVRPLGHLLWTCALLALVKVGLNAWEYPVEDGAYYLLKEAARGGGGDGAAYPGLYAHVLAFAMGAAGLYIGFAWSLSGHRLFTPCAMRGWTSLARRAAVTIASMALTGALGAFYVGWMTALQAGFQPATYGQAVAAAAFTLGTLGLAVLFAWRTSLRRLAMLIAVAGAVWLWAMAATLGGYLSVMSWA